MKRLPKERVSLAPDPDSESLFALQSPFRDPFRHRIFCLLRKSIERVSMLDQVDRVYRTILANPRTRGQDFFECAMEALDVRIDISAEDRARIPSRNPLVVVANHPFGGLEGVLLMRILLEARPDVKVMANYILGRIREMAAHSILVDPFGTRASRKANLGPVKEAIRWLREGHALLVFPSGEVSHLNVHDRRIEDPKWSESIAGIIRRTGASVLPVFVEGRNSALFQMMGMLHPRIRTAMLPRELIRRKGSVVRFRVGTPIPYSRLEGYGDPAEMMDFLRLRTYVLRSRGEEPARRGARARKRAAEVAPVAEPLFPELVAQDVMMLPPGQALLESGEFSVFWAESGQIPRLLHEIGRLREITFRGVGEGTGRAVDLDRFDQHYHHLVLWNRERQEVVGAYRLGPSDRILERQGKRGFYTTTLFRYRRALLDQIGPAIEMGRSFIRPEYQRSYSALLLLWKGIARYLHLHPRYKTLFGPVSINNEYNTVSRQMLEAFLRANRFDTKRARYVRPRNPPRRPLRKRWDPEILRRTIRSEEDLSDLIAEIEKDGKGVPILLKQYLRLGGKLLAFNVDPDFCNVLDGLIAVDLLGIDRRILDRFLGREAAEGYLRHHGAVPAAPPGPGE